MRRARLAPLGLMRGHPGTMRVLGSTGAGDCTPVYEWVSGVATCWLLLYSPMGTLPLVVWAPGFRV